MVVDKMNGTSHTKKDQETLQRLLEVLEDLGVLDHHVHSRWRVYPQNVSTAGIQLVADAAANTFGDWVEIIPLNTIPFPFEVVGLVVEQVSAVATYHIQFGYNIINADPGTNMEMGERRVRIVGLPVAREGELLHIHSQGLPAGSRVMGRVKTETLVADWARATLVFSRHVGVHHESSLWPAFPW